MHDMISDMIEKLNLEQVVGDISHEILDIVKDDPVTYGKAPTTVVSSIVHMSSYIFGQYRTMAEIKWAGGRGEQAISKMTMKLIEVPGVASLLDEIGAMKVGSRWDIDYYKRRKWLKKRSE